MTIPATVTIFSVTHGPIAIVTTDAQVAEGILRIFDGDRPVGMFAPGNWTHLLTSHAKIVPAALARGLADSAAGRVTDLGDFSQYAEDGS